MKISSFLAVLLGWMLIPVSAKTSGPQVDLGIDVLAARQFSALKGKRVGLITNATGVNKSGESTINLLRQAPGLRLVALYGPEHGVYGTVYAGDYVASSKDPSTGLPVYSLYGPTKKPSPDMLKGVDVLVYDIQDIGCRSYTFISTMGLAMQAAREAGIEFMVLDRPNPLSGNRVEGMPLDTTPRKKKLPNNLGEQIEEQGWRSFVGQWNIPYVYGLTCGELALMINGENWLDTLPESDSKPDSKSEPKSAPQSTSKPKPKPKKLKLTIIPMQGWTREQTWTDTGLMWVPTSPHIPTAESAYGYVLTGLMGDLEIVSHGVGYTLPFGLIGHESFDAVTMAQELNGRKWPGIWFRPIGFKPFYGTFKDKILQGVQWHIRDPSAVNLCATALRLLDFVRTHLTGSLFQNADQDEKKLDLFRKLCGGTAVEDCLREGKSVEALIQSWEPSLAQFRLARTPYLLYCTSLELPQATTSDPDVP